MSAGEAAFRARIERAIEQDEPSELADLALRVGQEGAPWEWAQSCCIQLARHRSALVRMGALSAFGHLARRYGRLDPGRVRRLVQIALHDPNAAVRAHADDIADDLLTFLGLGAGAPGGGAVTRSARRIACLVAAAAAALAWAGCSSAAGPAATAAGQAPTVIWISLDGVRHDYLDRGELPAFSRMERQGLRAERLRTVAPASTFPAHVSLATGAPPAVHGILDNRFWDPERGDFDYSNDASWIQAEPPLGGRRAPGSPRRQLLLGGVRDRLARPRRPLPPNPLRFRGRGSREGGADPGLAGSAPPPSAPDW